MKRILIIEDDKGIAELERDYLEANGFAVDMAFDGDTGEKKALQEAYDFIILDIMLPGRDGFQICRTIREARIFPSSSYRPARKTSTRSAAWASVPTTIS